MERRLENLMKQLQYREIMFQKQQKNFLKITEQFEKDLNLNSRQPENSTPKFCPGNLILQISEFQHDLETDSNFNNWFDKYKNVFRKDLATSLRRK